MCRALQEYSMMKRSCLNIALLATSLCLALPARAEPTRDAVMQGAERCEGIPDNRVWLDCFYGSAQPMRVLLGLSPAPVAQTFFTDDEMKRLLANVQGGTASVLKASGANGAKTGTAEVVSNGKVITNGWMVGYRGDVAFAVVVEGGASGSKAAGPILKNFLARFK